MSFLAYLFGDLSFWLGCLTALLKIIVILLEVVSKL